MDTKAQDALVIIKLYEIRMRDARVPNSLARR